MFYNDTNFWIFMAALVGAIRWLARVIYLYKVRSDENKNKLNMRVETFRSDNIQKSIDCFTGFMTRIEPLVAKHEVLMKDVQESIVHISTIEKGLNAMSKDLVKQYDDFQRKITNVTISFQSTIDRVDAFDKKLSALGKVTIKP